VVLERVALQSSLFRLYPCTTHVKLNSMDK